MAPPLVSLAALAMLGHTATMLRAPTCLCTRRLPCSRALPSMHTPPPLCGSAAGTYAMRSQEASREIMDFLMRRMRRVPARLVYDNGPALANYLMGRCPAAFAACEIRCAARTPRESRRRGLACD